MDASRHEVTLPSATVSYLEWAPSAPQRTVLLLHGGGVDSASLSWGGLGPALSAAGYRVIAPDHPGYGKSPLPQWTSSQARLLEYVGEFVEALGLDGVVVGGLSMGGAMALGMLLERPRGITAGMLFGSYGFMPRLGQGRFAGLLHWATWASVHSGLLDAVTRWYSKKRSRMNLSMAALIHDPARRTPELEDEIWAALQEGAGLTAFSQWQRSEYGRQRALTDYTPRLGEIAVPVLLVHGDLDPGVPIALARTAASRIPGARLLEVADAAHWVQRDRPEVVTPAVIGFLQSLDEVTVR